MLVTSSTNVAASSPRARIAVAASSISDLVRAASVTCAPAEASAEAAASPTPRPPPVTSARFPSRRKDGALARSITLQSARAKGFSPPLEGEGWLGGQENHLRPGAFAAESLSRQEVRSHLHSLRRLGIGHVTAAVTADTHIGLLGMCNEAFQHAQPRTIFADHGA